MLRKLSVRLLQREDEERRRIAQELQETTAQDLAALRLCLGEIKHVGNVARFETAFLQVLSFFGNQPVIAFGDRPILSKADISRGTTLVR